MTVTTSETIDQRPEIAANEIKVEVTMPAGNQVVMTLDASQHDSAIAVADAVRDFILKLLEA